MSTRTSVLLAILSLALPMASSARDLWSKNSETLKETAETIDWVSPGNMAKIHAGVDEAQLTVGGKVIDVQDVMNPGLTELNWSNEANALFINSSDGGDVGTWSTRVFVISGNGVHEVKVGAAVSKQRFPSAIRRKYMNVMSIGWINHGSALLVLRQVPNSSDYKDMNLARLYVVDVDSGRVIEQLTPADAAKRYRTVFGPGAEAIVSQSPNDVTSRQ
ncbi:MAG TPA: hypothetical protein VM621_13460 [Luteibacter sp.]|uniref:hypothetical protein n=1 Tax=Luteibacter sp. TaxID=1886636 RepID=UPI002B551CF2|nr:hypothetical protein [Luteibacter sp.]HVI56044.1 hypothetical protein [Luteibacter sp.]